MKLLLALTIIVLAFVATAYPQTDARSDQACIDLEKQAPEFQPLVKACRYAISAPRTLPDFVCTEIVKRYFSPQDKPETIAAQLTVEKMRSHYENVTVNGKAITSRRTGDDLFEGKAGSTGEFALLFNVFDASSQADFARPVDAPVGSKRLKRYDYRVQRKHNTNWTWYFVGAATNPGYHGSIFVDEKTGDVSRLVVKVDPDEVDADTPVSQATTTIDYGDVDIGTAGIHHVPIGGEAVSCFRFMEGCIRAAITFRNFHKFGADTRIVPATP